MISYQQACTYRRSRANEERARRAARQQAAAARAALAVLAENGVGPNLSSTRVWRRQWIEVLRRRAADDVSTLGGLAASMTPPMTKDAFAGQLRRACRFATELASGNVAGPGVAAEQQLVADSREFGASSLSISTPNPPDVTGTAGFEEPQSIPEQIRDHHEAQLPRVTHPYRDENPRRGKSHVGF